MCITKTYTLQLTRRDLSRVALALSAAGLVANGGRPSDASMAIMMAEREEFKDLTANVTDVLQKVCDDLIEASK